MSTDNLNLLSTVIVHTSVHLIGKVHLVTGKGRLSN